MTNTYKLVLGAVVVGLVLFALLSWFGQAENRDRLRAWWKARIVKGFWKSYTWLTTLGSVLVGVVPDLFNLVLSNWSMVDALPTLSVEHKLVLFSTVQVANLVLRALKQRNMPQATVPVAVVNVPETVDLVTSPTTSVPVATEVHEQAAQTEAAATRTHL